MTGPLTVAIAVPVWNEEKVLPELLQRLDRVCAGVPEIVWRWIFVDDGSTDGSTGYLREQGVSDPRVELVELSRNFGHQPALSAALVHAADADAVITMDADLQDPPEMIPEILRHWQNGAEVVLARRTARTETGVRRIGFDLFHLLFNHLSDFPVPPHTGTFGLLTQSAVVAFNALPERHRFFPGLRAWIGFRVEEVSYERHDRAADQPRQTLRRLVRYALDGVFSFSRFPLRLVTWLGVFVSLSGFAVALFFVVKRLLGLEVAQTGFTTLVTLMLFLGGVQLIAIGVLGEYLGRIYDEAKQRPLYVVRRRS